MDAKEAATDDNDGSNPIDDSDLEALEDVAGDFTRQELFDAIGTLNEEEQINLVALAWLGRGTFDITEWQSALDTARSEHNGRTAQYLLGLPLLGDYLEEGLMRSPTISVDAADCSYPGQGPGGTPNTLHLPGDHSGKRLALLLNQIKEGPTLGHSVNR